MPSRSSRSGSAVFATIFIGFFGVGFAAIGIVGVVSACRKGDWKGTTIASVFALIAIGLLVAIIFGVRYTRRQRALQQAEPDKPWMWNADWSSGTVRDHAIGGALGSWILTAVVNGISLPPTIICMREFSRDRDPKLLLVLLFSCIGFCLVVLSIRATLRARRFGGSTFQLQTLPGVIGGTLAGTIHVPRSLQANQKIRLHLTCTQFIRSTGNTTSQGGSSKTLLWEEEQEVDHPTFARDGSDIPVRFAIPRNQLPTGLPGDRADVIWRLEASAKMQGIDYLSRFTVPVFRLPSTSSSMDASAAPSMVVPEPTRYTGPAREPAEHRGITLSRLANGGCTVVFAAGRNIGMVVFLALMGILVTAGPLFLPLPWIPITVIWIAAILLDLAFLNVLLASTTITAGLGGLHIDRGLPLCRFRRDLTAASINEIRMQITTTLGDTAYYTLQAVADGRSFTIVRGVRGKPTAEWLSLEIERSLQLKR